MTSVVVEGGQQVGLGGQLIELALAACPSRLMPVSMWSGCRKLAPARPAVGGPVAHLGEAGEHGAQIEARIVRLGAGQQAVEHIDGGAGLHLARGAAFVERWRRRRSCSLRW